MFERADNEGRGTGELVPRNEIGRRAAKSRPAGRICENRRLTLPFPASDAGEPERSARAGRVLGGPRCTRCGYDARGHVSVRGLNVRGGRARHYGVLATAVITPVLRNGAAAGALAQHELPAAHRAGGAARHDRPNKDGVRI